MKKSKTHYETLGVDKRADKATIKRSYKNKAKQLHPDKGGSHTAFVALQRAFKVLSDDSLRARYDEFGDEEPPKHNEGLSLFISVFMQVIEEAPDSNALRLSVEHLTDTKSSLQGQQQELREKLHKANKQITLYQLKEDGENIIVNALTQKITGMRSTLGEMDRRCKITDEAIAIAHSYQYLGEDLPSESESTEEMMSEMINQLKGFKYSY